MKRQRLKNSKEAAKYRADLLKSQKGLDPIIKEKVKDPVLDHNHKGEQECRAVLDRTVNSFEGKVQNAYDRYIKHLTDTDLPTILRNLADYYEQDYSNMHIHHTALTVDVRKFKSLPSAQQCSILESFNVVPESNTAKRSNQARKLIKSGDLDMTQIKKGA
ncbi:putative EndoVII packaging and recombination endonuclease [Erwinia phage pEa_SNUABM_50]|uniref:Putative EndoVII packaging and recombination endonuclease n=1 Tax=Erwinia phage pEa_SNUABM_50 TaxID=2768775 RepID=A0A7L8ZP58_9CAUD|nr:putative EndoVII packaging and recombination endonuclease [Erwinia phage pEa_SNUABM_50]QXO11392.1 hypothetical protein pEaSNUABM19_00246 [Erwinia phage pEa_SNUABM_19]